MLKLKPNQKVLSEDGQREFTVDCLIHTGSGQGDIYKVHAGKDVYAMKLFHTGKVKRIRRQIENLRRRGKASSAFVHPLHIVKVGEAIGYVMEYVSDDLYDDGSILFNGIEVDDGQGNIIRMELPFNQKIAIMYNIAEAIKILYEADIALMDLKFENIKINKYDMSVKILDTDTAVGSRTKPIVSGTIGFMPPLTMRGEEVPNKYNDSFAFGVMVGMTFWGCHPLIGRKYEEPCSTNIDTYTFATNPIYIFNRNAPSNRPLDSNKRVTERMKKYPQYFVDAMHQTFVDGLYDGKKRVEPREWQEILVRLYNDHYLCRHCGEEHFFGGTAKHCNVCGALLEPPIKLMCDKNSAPGVHLFNGAELWSTELWGDQSNYQLFKVVVSDYDKKYGLLCTGAQSVTAELKNGQCREFQRGETIPIFMDAVLKVGKYSLKFIGGQVK